MPLHLFAIDHLTFPPEASRYSTRAVESIEFVNPVLQSDLLGGRLSRPIIKARSIQTQQLCLRLYAKLGITPFNESGSLIAMKGRGQIFFEPTELRSQFTDFSVKFLDPLVVGGD